jgi:CheY-like chemotaxis protein
MQVLVVEDEVLIRMLVCDLLEEAGHDCVAVVTAEQALLLLAQQRLRPDILVTDYNLGPGLDGQALVQQVQTMLPGLPTVFVTGNPDCFTEYHFEAWERLVAKPFSGEALVEAIGAVVPVPVRPAGIAAEGLNLRAALSRALTGLGCGDEEFA